MTGVASDVTIPPDWLTEFEAMSRRPSPVRMRCAFIHTYKLILDDAEYRALDTMAGIGNGVMKICRAGWVMAANKNLVMTSS